MCTNINFQNIKAIFSSQRITIGGSTLFAFLLHEWCVCSVFACVGTQMCVLVCEHGQLCKCVWPRV